MPRRSRFVVPGLAYHLTQRGVDRQDVFSDVQDRETYLGLLKQNLGAGSLQVLAWCLMSNHLHLVVVPEHADSLATTVRRIHGRYAQYYNARWARCGHLWQSRFYACALDEAHLWRAIAYVERNPVRAGMAAHALDYEWSSARAHLNGCDSRMIVDMNWWQSAGPQEWLSTLGREDIEVDALRRCTCTGCPFGDEPFVDAMRERSGRQWRPGRPRNADVKASSGQHPSGQFSLFSENQ